MTRAPIFIVGSYRSGTSILTWCLGQHSNIWLLPETYWIAQFARSVPELYSHGTAQEAAHFTRCALSEDDFRAEAAAFVDNVVAKGQERRLRKQVTQWQKGASSQSIMRLQRSFDEPKQRWVDGTPENTHSIEQIHNLFPEAKFLHLVRSPHEVVRSLAKFDNAGGDPQEAAEAYGTWNRLCSAAWQAEQTLGSDVVRRFKNTDLTENPEQLIRDICAFIDEDFEPACLQPLQKKINSSDVDHDAVPSRDSLPKKLREAYDDNDALFQELIA